MGEELLFPARSPASSGFNVKKTASTNWLRKKIKKAVESIGLTGKDYSGHSLRAGGATDLFNMKVPFYVVKKMGRWKSNVALIYFRDVDNIGKVVGKAFSKMSMKVQKRKNRAT